MAATALVVDDDRLLLRLVELNLGRVGIRVLLADSGSEALRIAREAKPDVILLDLIMPVMDGYEVLRQLKSGESTREIPVVVLSAKPSLDDRRRCEDMGAAGFIGKPFNLDELRAAVRAIVGLDDPGAT